MIEALRSLLSWLRERRFEMTFLSLFATIFGVVSALAILPQAIKIFKRKSAKDVSILTYLFFFAGTIVWFSYGIELQNSAIIIGNSIGGINNILVIVGWMMYGRVKKVKI